MLTICEVLSVVGDDGKCPWTGIDRLLQQEKEHQEVKVRWETPEIRWLVAHLAALFVRDIGVGTYFLPLDKLI